MEFVLTLRDIFAMLFFAMLTVGLIIAAIFFKKRE